eukprot:6078313-Amphidinium_carterae.1
MCIRDSPSKVMKVWACGSGSDTRYFLSTESAVQSQAVLKVLLGVAAGWRHCASLSACIADRFSPAQLRNPSGTST